MGTACGTCGGEEKCLQMFVWENLKKIDNFETLGLHRKMILKRIIMDYCMWLNRTNDGLL